MGPEQEVKQLESLARLNEQDAARDFKEAGLFGAFLGVATLVGYEVAEKLPNEIASEAASRAILAVGMTATTAVVAAGMTAGYLRKREAKDFQQEADKIKPILAQ